MRSVSVKTSLKLNSSALLPLFRLWPLLRCWRISNLVFEKLTLPLHLNLRCDDVVQMARLSILSSLPGNGAPCLMAWPAIRSFSQVLSLYTSDAADDLLCVD